MRNRENEDTWHHGGLHGTTITAALNIAQEGFRVNEGGSVFMALFGDSDIAHQAGKDKARVRGDDEYAVIEAAIPPSELEFGINGDHLKIPAELADAIEVTRILAFKLKPENTSDYSGRVIWIK